MKPDDETAFVGPAPENSEKRAWAHAFLGTRGGKTRLRIVTALWDGPLNTNQLASALRLHYTTVQHHIRLLEEHGVVTSSPKEGYAVLRFLTPQVRRDADFLRTIAERLGVVVTFPPDGSGGRMLYNAASYGPPVGVAQPGGASDS